MIEDRLPYPHARASVAGTVAANAPGLARIRTVLVRPSLPANIGAAARALMTMGLTRVVLVAPARFPDAEAMAVASGAAAVLDAARVVATLDEALAGTELSIGLSARPRRFAGRTATLTDAVREAVNTAAARADAAAAGAEVALVFGTETSGLSNDELSRCTLAATIPANAEYPSLNLAAAVQVVAWEIRRAAGMRGDDGPASRRGFAAATHDEVEALYAHAQRTLGALEFLDARRPRRLFQRLRRLFGRTRLEREEVNILRGILARVDERIGASGAARIAVPPPEAKR